MENYSDNQPNAAKLMESLRSSGYDNYNAIADLIDNSFDANADDVRVNIGGGVGKSQIVTISDNGDGMDAATLDQALRLGSKTGQDDDRLGKYGLGLITASISMGKHLTVITKHDGKFITGIHDLEKVISTDKFIKEIRDSSMIEKQSFLSKLGHVKSGTVIIIKDLDNLQNKNTSAFSATLIRKLGETFRDFINANKKISINDKDVWSVDPMFRPESEELIDVTHDFQVDGEQSMVRLRVFHLPKLSLHEAKEKGINIPNQGFYLMRNNRQIARGESLGMFTKHNYDNRFRAEIYFSGKVDKLVGVNFKKEDVSLSDEMFTWIRTNAFPQIQAIYNIASRKESADKPNIDHGSATRVISNKSTILKKPKIEVDNPIKELSILDRDGFADVDFVVEHNTHLAPLYQVDLTGKRLTIRYNADHIFYETVMKGAAQDNKDLLNAIDFLTYSTALSLIGITSSEETAPLKDKFVDDLSDNLRALMS
jgi:hypothetical protein